MLREASDVDEPIIKTVVVPRERIPELAITLMMAGILVPTMMYSFRLQGPSPAELLVAVSIALFAAVLFLWIMDATGLLPFRAAWISKAVYGAAITSILGTSVAVYKDFFYADKYPFDGHGRLRLPTLTIPHTQWNSPCFFHLAILVRGIGGYSALISHSTDGRALVWVEAVDVSPQDRKATFRLHFGDGHQELRRWPLAIEKKGKWLESAQTNSKLELELHRPA